MKKAKLNFKKNNENTSPDLIRISVEDDLRELDGYLPYDTIDLSKPKRIDETRKSMTSRAEKHPGESSNLFFDFEIDTGRIKIPENWQELDPQIIEMLKEGIELDESIERLEGSIFKKKEVS